MRKTRNRVENAQKCNSNTSICLTSCNEQTCSWRRKKKRWEVGTEKLEIFGPVFCNRNKRSLKSFIWKCSQTGKSDNYCSRTLEICNRVWLHTNHIWELKSVSKKNNRMCSDNPNYPKSVCISAQETPQPALLQTPTYPFWPYFSLTSHFLKQGHNLAANSFLLSNSMQLFSFHFSKSIRSCSWEQKKLRNFWNKSILKVT